MAYGYRIMQWLRGLMLLDAIIIKASYAVRCRLFLEDSSGMQRRPMILEFFDNFEHSNFSDAFENTLSPYTVQT